MTTKTTTTTTHDVHFADARDLSIVADASVHLVVTSPPYPMIAMWDEAWDDADGTGERRVANALAEGDGAFAFELMHESLDAVWRECFRVLANGGLMCVNIGDATRKIGDGFRLFSNHARILQAVQAIGFTALPDILWRKPTNAPNKFLGSGMLPAGAYVTYEHEYILILRKGGLREFPTDAEKRRRRRSAYFWEERNEWFSDVWAGLVGTRQKLLDDADIRSRSAAFPFELAWRLIQMHSAIGDVVLDPFLGTGTTSAAALASGRSSIGIERDESFRSVVDETMRRAVDVGRERAQRRLDDHAAFVERRLGDGKVMKNENKIYGFPVITKQEAELELVAPVGLRRLGEDGEMRFEAEVEPLEIDVGE